MLVGGGGPVLWSARRCGRHAWADQAGAWSPGPQRAAAVREAHPTPRGIATQQPSALAVAALVLMSPGRCVLPLEAIDGGQEARLSRASTILGDRPTIA